MTILIIHIVICKVVELFYVLAAYLCVGLSALVSPMPYALTYRDNMLIKKEKCYILMTDRSLDSILSMRRPYLFISILVL